ncbi:MAG TPA: type II secretion system protein [Vicinamibacterales bacterium]|jgi:prepilin-type N-terminal cleavage/methylation domain
MRSRAMKRNQGFTLIELLVVMAIAVILAGVGMTIYGTSVTRAKEAALSEDLFQMRKAIDEYYADKQKYPSSLDALVSEKYLREIKPDPFTQTVDWQTTMSEPDAANPSAETGIWNVKSGAPGTGSDGRPYSEW